MPILRLPLAGELQGALTDGFADGLIGGNGGEPFGLGLDSGTQKADQTQRLTLRSQLRCARPRVPHIHDMMDAVRKVDAWLATPEHSRVSLGSQSQIAQRFDIQDRE